MERKVIKINLMGAIFVLVLIVAIIVGIIVFAIKSGSNKESNNKNNEETEQNSKFSVNKVEDKEAYEEVDKKEDVVIDGESKEITLRDYHNPRYEFSYDVDGFYKDPHVKDKDSFKSLVSDTISIDVTFCKDGFKNKAKELLNGIADKRAENSQYNVTTKDINGKLCYIEELEKENGVKRNYYIENGDAYFLLNINCGKEFVKNQLPIIEKMVESFEAY